MKWNPSTPPPTVTAHKAVAVVAEQMGRELYESFRYDNDFNKMCKENNLDETAFIEYFAPYFRKGARALMTAQLTDISIPQLQKDEIMEALALDQILPNTGVSAVKK